MLNGKQIIDLSISLYGTWIWRPDVNSNLSKSPFCWFWRLTSWFVPAKKLKSNWGSDIIIYHVPSHIPTEMFFFVCHHHGKQVVKFGSKRVLVCSFYFSSRLPQMNVSRVLEATFIRRFENIMFFRITFRKKMEFHICLPSYDQIRWCSHRRPKPGNNSPQKAAGLDFVTTIWEFPKHLQYGGVVGSPWDKLQTWVFI